MTKRLRCLEGGQLVAAGATGQLEAEDNAASMLHPTQSHSQSSFSVSEMKELSVDLEPSAESLSISRLQHEETTALDTQATRQHQLEPAQHDVSAHTVVVHATATSTDQQTISVQEVPPDPVDGHESERKTEEVDSTRSATSEEISSARPGSDEEVEKETQERMGEASEVADGETTPDIDSVSLSEGAKADISGKPQSDHFQSYSEWRQKVLEEEQKSKQDNSAVPSNQQTVSKPKVRINLASNTCGAKVLASNPEAENVQGVLTSNRDDYMLNPCSAPKKWFVIELCEPVQVKTIEIASLELFSSQPKTFRLLSSDRYPAKEWHEQGEFEATEEKTAQVFQVEDQHFLKFLKLELLDHYGHEHFCPITLFRVFGVPMADDDDEDEEVALTNNIPDTSTSEEETVLLQEGEENAEKENSRNLFMSAKDTVLNLVKKVLNVEETDRDPQSADLSEKHDVNISTGGFLLPCVQETDEMKKDKKKLPTAEVPHPHVDASSNSKDVPIVTKLQDDEQIPSESRDGEKLVTLVTEHAGPLHLCGDSAKNKTNHTTSQHQVICSYVQTMLNNKIEQTCSMLPVNTQISSESIATTNFILLDKSSMEVSTTSSGESIVEACTTHSQSDSETKVLIEDSSKVISLPPAVTDHLTDTESQKKPTELSEDGQHTDFHTEIASELHSPQAANGVTTGPVKSTSIPSSQSLAVETSHLEPSISDQQMTAVASQKQTPFLSESNILPEATESSSGGESSNMFQVSPSPASELVSSEGGLPTKVAATVSVVDEEEEEEGLGDIDGETVESELSPQDRAAADRSVNSSRNKGLDLVHVPLAPIAKRETAIMRLTNRIKALELNVSLSSRFLDELSHRFKKQSEDVMRLLNKTISHFTNVTNRAEARDLVQQEQLDKLESRVENLTVLMTELSHNMEQLNSRITDRQLVWTTVEFVLLVLVCVVCLRRGGGAGNVVRPAEVRQLLEMMPQHPQLLHTRRNSVGAVGHITPSTPIKKQASDSALAQVTCNDTSQHFEIVEQNNLLLPQPVHKDGCKKKKRKKNKNFESKSMTNALTDDRSTSTKLNRSAGLLFGVDAVSVLTGLPTTAPNPVSSTQMKSSPHKSSSKSLPTHSRQSSQTSIEIHLSEKDTHTIKSKSSGQPVLSRSPPQSVSDLVAQGRRGEVQLHHSGASQCDGLTNGTQSNQPSCDSLLWRPPDYRSEMKGLKVGQGRKGWSLRKTFGFE